MNDRKRSVALRLAVSVISVCAAAAVRLALDPLQGEHHPYTLFFAAIALSAWYAGFWPSVVALALSFLKLFSPFMRLEGERYGGMGMGLALVAKAVEKMQGKVGVESQEGKGSRFWLELPRARGQPHEHASDGGARLWRSPAAAFEKPRDRNHTATACCGAGAAA